MNEKNVQKAIDIMKRAAEHDCIDMTSYQSANEESNLVRYEDELHACGNKACFAGYIAVSPEFRADGGCTSFAGSPMIYKKLINTNYPVLGYVAIAEWLGIHSDIAYSFVHGDLDDDAIVENGGLYSGFYEKDWSDITADDVIVKLEQLLETGAV